MDNWAVQLFKQTAEKILEETIQGKTIQYILKTINETIKQEQNTIEKEIHL